MYSEKIEITVSPRMLDRLDARAAAAGLHRADLMRAYLHAGLSGDGPARRAPPHEPSEHERTLAQLAELAVRELVPPEQNSRRTTWPRIMVRNVAAALLLRTPGGEVVRPTARAISTMLEEIRAGTDDAGSALLDTLIEEAARHDGHLPNTELMKEFRGMTRRGRIDILETCRIGRRRPPPA